MALSLALSACSTDGLAPPERIDAGRVGAIRPDPTAFPAPQPVADARGEIEVPADPRMRASQLLPPAGENAAYALPAAQTQAVVLPAQGVDMDAMLGVAPVVGLAQEQSRDIAEGATVQPVVAGIGGPEPRQIDAARAQQGLAPPPMEASGIDPDLPPLSAEKQAAEEARQAQFLETEQRAMLRRRQRQEESQVAFLPRADSPLSVPQMSDDAMPASETACRRRLKKLGVDFRDVARIANGPSCGIDYPIELTGLSGGIDVKPAVKLNCAVTEAFAQWVKNELAPAARTRYLSGVKTIKPLGGYSCRTMNSQRGNPMSEHAHGNAIDVGKFVLNSGKEIDVRKPGFFAFREKGLLKAVRSDSCKYFTTVLGPGSDPHHKDHFHFDLRQHRAGGRYCK